uniref:Integrator complex subunit 9 n=1 Tax=Cacopsylla melanoneura TaxID=428564 RepID=A0A8D8R9A0_9HEMI
MKVYSLSSHPNKACYILRFKEMTIMLDCGLCALPLLHFLPLPIIPSNKFSNLPSWIPRDCTEAQLEGELKECCGKIFIDSAPEFQPPLSQLVDFSEVNMILISNYLSMLALPFITEGTGFEGVVYATEPTLQIGKFYLEELVQYIEKTPKLTSASHWKDIVHLPSSPFPEHIKPRSWRQLYNLQSVYASLARVQMVGYDEKLDVFGSLRVTPVSSGYCLGSSNWIISSDHEKIAYVSGSSTLTTHPRPMDQQALKNANVLLLSGLTQTPISNPDAMLGELCMTVVGTLRANGSVLVPCYPSGVIYDLFECLSSHLDSSSLTQIPMFFISPVADISLAYSNILAEWLSDCKQSKVYLPEEPFPHAHLIKTGRLKHFKSIHDDAFNAEFRQPCIVFCGHPSLRFGDSVHFVQLWASNPLHTIIFTEPDFPYVEALAPFQPLAMKSIHCPIDTSLNFSQANKLIRELKPSTLVVPECYTQPPPAFPQRTELVIDQVDRKVLTLKRGEVLKIPLKRKRTRVNMSAEIAEAVEPCELRPGLAIASVKGNLRVKDNHYCIDMSTSSRSHQYEMGALDVEQFVERLVHEGITEVKVEPNATGYIIHLQNEDCLITVDDKSTHILCSSSEKFRLKLRTILLQCLNTF